MTVHRIRLFHSTSGATSYHQWLDQWMLNVEAATDTEVVNGLPDLTETIDGGSEYYRGELVFEWSEGRNNILDNLDQHASSHCSWHRIGYHECSHDDEGGGPCSWDERRQDGPVPSHVPTVQP